MVDGFGLWKGGNMNNTKRFENLIKCTKFQGAPDSRSKSPLLDLANHNLAEWDKIGEEQNEVISHILASILTDIVQPLAIVQFGHTDDSAIRGVIHNELFLKDEFEELNSLGEQVQKEALGIGLSETQSYELHKWFVSYFPNWLVACIADLIKSGDPVKRLKIIWNVEYNSSHRRIYDILLKGNTFKEGVFTTDHNNK